MMNRDQAEEFLKRQRQAILATTRADGRPQLSNVLSAYDEGKLLVSITENRAKFRNLQRDPRATILVLGPNFWEYLVLDGQATMVALPEAQPLLRRYYELAAGQPHPNWDEYDQSMRDEKRVMLTISVDHVYPLAG